MIFLIVFFAILIAGIVFTIYESTFRVDLINNPDFEKLKRLRINRLELKRYRVNTYLNGRGNSSKRKLVQIDAPVVESTNLFNVINETLVVEGHGRKIPHDIFQCHYTPELRDRLSELVSKYNENYFTADR